MSADVKNPTGPSSGASQAQASAHPTSERLLALEVQLAQIRRLVRVAAWSLAAVGLGGLALASQTSVAAGACAQILPSPLVTFCPGDPALASQMNGNFQGMVNFVEQKVGPLGDAHVKTGEATVAGTASATAIVAKDVKVAGKLNADEVFAAKALTVGGLPAVSGHASMKVLYGKLPGTTLVQKKVSGPGWVATGAGCIWKIEFDAFGESPLVIAQAINSDEFILQYQHTKSSVTFAPAKYDLLCMNVQYIFSIVGPI